MLAQSAGLSSYRRRHRTAIWGGKVWDSEEVTVRKGADNIGDQKPRLPSWRPTLPDQFPTPKSVERLAFLSERVLKIADVDPGLSGSERASLMMAAQLIAVVREGKLGRLAAAN
jgi:hypothetical protein